MKVYKGRRIHNGCEVTVVENGKPIRSLRHFILHSPEGFNWGYGGSGPAELALGILLDHFDEVPTPTDLYMGDTKAQALHQKFKWAFISPIKTPTWEITSEEIQGWLEGLEASDLFGKDVRVG